MADMDDITKRLAVLNDTLKLFIEAWECRTCSEERTLRTQRLDELCKIIVKLGGTITETMP